jgi:ribosomal protein S18 acetylase RimI-like enzyme
MRCEQVEQKIEIRPLLGLKEARQCARFMAASEPWVTLQRSYQDSLDIFADSSKEISVAVVQRQLVGFIVIVMQGAFVGTIHSVGVFKGWQACGIGRRLIHFAEKRIFSETPNAFICVSSFNPRAQDLYERLGYKVIGELPDLVLPGHTEILMRKSIGPLIDDNSQ